MKPTEDDVVKQMAADIHEIIAALSKQVHEQEQEIAELRKDKERLDWLESNPVGIGYPTEEMSEEAFFIFTNDRDFGGKILRQAIDAAKEGK